MFGSKARRITELEADLVANKSLVERSRAGMRRMRAILGADETEDLFELAEEIMKEHEGIKLDLHNVQVELDEALAKIPKKKPVRKKKKH